MCTGRLILTSGIASGLLFQHLLHKESQTLIFVKLFEIFSYFEHEWGKCQCSQISRDFTPCLFCFVSKQAAAESVVESVL